MLEIGSNKPQTASRPEPSPGDGRPQQSRQGVILTYPMFRYWNKAAIDEGQKLLPLNVYVHMPYCIQRCAYCYFKTTTLKENRLEEIDRYVQAVCRELGMLSRHFGLANRPVETVYFGGGTPTLMTEDNIDRLFAALRESFNLVEPEITCEGEPVTLTPRKAAALARNGVNRISLGIQSFKEEIVFQTGRRDTEEQAFASIALAKSTGAQVNIDLISGLAGETPETWAYSVQRALAADVHTITIYKLELYANTPYYSSEKTKEIALPTDEQELALINYAVAELKRHDYRPINAFTFSKGGAYDQKNTRSRWLGHDSCAAGVSAYGSIGRWNYQNMNDIPGYVAAVGRGELPVFRGYNCTTIDLMVRDAVMGIKLVHLDHQRFREKHGVDLLRTCDGALSELAAAGMITVDDRHVSLTDQGLLFGDYVARVLEGPLKQLGGESPGTRARVRF